MFEVLGITLAELEHFFLVAMRLAALFFSVPIISHQTIPINFKVLISFFFAAIISAIIPVPDFLPVSMIYLIYYAAIEIIIGLVLGIITTLIFEAIQLAGFLIARLMGLMMATMVDPDTGLKNSVLGEFLKYMVILLLFAVSAHHFFINILFENFYLIPISEPVFDGRLITQFSGMVLTMFSTGLKLAAPLMAILFIQRVLLAIFSKVNPEMNVFIIGLPLGLLVGFFALIYFMPYFAYEFNKVFNIYKDDVYTVMEMLGKK